MRAARAVSPPPPVARRVRPVVLALVAGLFLALGSGDLRAQEVVEYYATDALGSIRVVFDVNGVELGRADYLPFGEELSSSAGLPPERFTGQARDGEVGLDYFNARMYDLTLGAFTAPDPMLPGTSDPQRWNRYRYVRSNPITNWDPSGLYDCPTWISFGGTNSSGANGVANPGCASTGIRSDPYVVFANGAPIDTGSRMGQTSVDIAAAEALYALSLPNVKTLRETSITNQAHRVIHQKSGDNTYGDMAHGVSVTGDYDGAYLSTEMGKWIVKVDDGELVTVAVERERPVITFDTMANRVFTAMTDLMKPLFSSNADSHGVYRYEEWIKNRPDWRLPPWVR